MWLFFGCQHWYCVLWVCVGVLPHAVEPGDVVLVVTAYCCAFIVMAMFFSHSRACSFLFAVSFGGIVASAKPLALPHPLAHMFVCVRL